ncbi:MAG: YibE/F family protein [Lachnospiraceae bacterium]|nr:YibE/F family protein [Lachnospiraceae bacterium]
MDKLKKNIGFQLPVILCIILILILIILPTGYEDSIIYQGTDRCSAKVLKTDESEIISTGLIKSGEQTCQIELLGGKFEGTITQGYNLLNGSLESDKIFEVGDRALVVISYQEDKILSVNMIDHYRIGYEIVLLILFAIALIAFARVIGIRSLLSFAISILSIWKILVPLCLKGYDPVVIGLMLVCMIAVVILSLVYGFDKRFLSAFSGVLLGILITCVLGIFFTSLFKIHGAIMANSESLLYSGYQNLNLTRIFMSSIFIGASGAVIDIAVDITSAIAEVVQKKPEIEWKEASKSGFNIGRAAMGTMTTTLLLAYSGGYLALLMVFMAQGTPIANILNYKYVAGEIIQTVVGCFGLVAVAPFTAVIGGWLLTRDQLTGSVTINEVPSSEELLT